MDNIEWQHHAVTKAMRATLNRQKPCLLWFTGLSGSGKTTLANALERSLHKQGNHTYLLDGDNIRQGLCADLGFSEADRDENIRRIGEVANLFVDAGVIVLCAFISPFRLHRARARQLCAAGEFIEIYLSTPLAVCESRDPRGLYEKARRGEIKQFTGIDSPYQVPDAAELVINTADNSVEQCASLIIDYLRSHDRIK